MPMNAALLEATWEKIREKMDANGDGQLSSDERNAAKSNLRDKIRERLSSSSNNASNN